MPSLEKGRCIYAQWARFLGVYTLMARSVLLGRDADLRDRAVAMLELEKGDTVLDLGCGPGVNLQRLEHRIGAGGHVVAFDYSDEMLGRVGEATGRNRWRNVAMVQGDAARLPLDDSSVDAALCTLALSVMPEPEAATREVYRCLRPGARFAVIDVKPFEGSWRVLNPAALAVFVPTTNWNVTVDLVATMRTVFGNVKGVRLNRGSAFLALSRKYA
jgi:demethylmenaquinone methyltransferase/2-methoxy-6-polyprenyl-1,4-benzoquinol methylase